MHHFFAFLFVVSFLSVFAQPSATVQHVENAFAAIPTHAQKVTFDFEAYTIPKHGGHYQGIQLMESKGEKYAYITGSSETVAYYFAISLGETNKVAAFNSLLTKPMKHAGGFQIIQDILVVGVEDDKARTVSKILFYSLDNPLSTNIQPLISIDRDGLYQQATAGAVAITRWNDKHLLFVGTWDNATIDVYSSNGFSLNDPNCSFKMIDTWVSYKADRSHWIDKNYGSYQNMNLINQSDGRYYLIAFCKTEKGEDRADLFEVNVSENIPNKKWLIKKGTKIFHCRKTSFKSGSGVFITQDGKMEIYSCAHHGNILEVFSEKKYH
ncbi:MAG: hypothetical protein AAGI07_06205 [Bacteroidota bacterium]